MSITQGKYEDRNNSEFALILVSKWEVSSSNSLKYGEMNTIDKKKFEYSPIYVHFYEVGGENDTFPRSLQFKLLLKSIELFCSS